MPAPASEGFRVAFRADKAAAYLREWQENGLEAAQAKHGHNQEAEAGVPTIRDPRGFGAPGAYPRTGNRNNPALLDRLYEEVGVFGAVVDQWASDTFSEAWTLKSESNPEWAEDAMDVLLDLDVPGVVEDSDRNVLMHGHGVLLFRLSDVQKPDDLRNKPAPTAELLEIVSVDIPKVGVAKERAQAKAGESTLEALDLKLRQGRTVACDEGRLLVVRERPVLDDPVKGKPFLKRCVDDVVLYENMKYWGGESYSRRASPLIQAVVDPEAKLDDARRQAIASKLRGLINGTAQSAIVKDYKFEAVSGYSGIANPQVHWQMAIDSLAVSSRVPKHILMGSAAGELASSMQDEKRYYARVSRRQERYGTRVVRAVVERLAQFGAIEAPPEDWTIAWEPLDEPTRLERAQAWQAAADAFVKLRAARVPLPAELLDYPAGELPDDPGGTVEPEPDPDPSVPPPAPGPPTGQAPPGQPPAAAGEAADSPATLAAEDPDLKVVRLRHQGRVYAALEDWMEAYARVFDADPRSQEQGGAIQPTDPILRAVDRVRPDPGVLAATLRRLYLDAGLLGGSSRLRLLAEGATSLRAPAREAAVKDFEFLDDTATRTFKRLADTLAKQQAESLTGTIRASLARGLAAGEGVRDLKFRVLGEFDFTPMEAERIARTESMRGFNYGGREALRQVGAQRYRLEVFGDACSICGPLEGQSFPIGDSDHVSPLHPNCRCVVVQA